MSDIATKLTTIAENQIRIRDKAYEQGAAESAALIDRTVDTIDRDDITEIGNGAFYYAQNLTTARFKNATHVGNSAFGYCQKLFKIDFHNVQYIDTAAFANCSSLSAIIIRRQQGICSLAAATSLPTSSKLFIYVPGKLLNNYKSATNWASHAAKIRALEDYTTNGTANGDLDPNKTGA